MKVNFCETILQRLNNPYTLQFQGLNKYMCDNRILQTGSNDLHRLTHLRVVPLETGPRNRRKAPWTLGGFYRAREKRMGEP